MLQAATPLLRTINANFGTVSRTAIDCYPNVAGEEEIG
jgi:hypothetical protein